MKYKRQSVRKSVSIIILCTLFIHTWFFFPKETFSGERISFSTEVLLLYGKLCQLPAFFTQEVLSSLPREKKTSPSAEKRQVHLFWILLSLPVLTIVLFFKRRMRCPGLKDTPAEPSGIIRGDFSFYLLYLRKFLIALFMTQDADGFPLKFNLVLRGKSGRIFFSRIFLLADARS